MQTVDELIRQLETGNLHGRTLAARALGDHHDPRAIDALIQILEDQSEDCAVRMAAADALGRIGNPKAMEPLIRTIGEMCDRHLLQAVAKALGAFQGPRVTDALVKALGYEYYTAHAAAESLKKHRDRRAVEPLIDDSKTNRAEATGAHYPRRFSACWATHALFPHSQKHCMTTTKTFGKPPANRS